MLRRFFSAAPPNASSLLKELRARTSAGLMDCKKALEQSNYDLDDAYDWLRSRGVAMAAKKASRVASEGLVALCVGPSKKIAAAVELNSETDFVARNAEFQALVARIAESSVVDRIADTTQLQELHKDAITNLIAKVGENIQLRRSVLVNFDMGTSSSSSNEDVSISSYMHGRINNCNSRASIGSIASLVAVSPASANPAAIATGDELAMHIAAMRPLFLSREMVTAEALERETVVIREQISQVPENAKKPANVLEKMITGRLGKFYEDVCLLEQKFVLEQKKTIAQIVQERQMRILAFERLAKGEGLTAPASAASSLE